RTLCRWPQPHQTSKLMVQSPRMNVRGFLLPPQNTDNSRTKQPLCPNLYTQLVERMARPERFELPTFWFVARRSIQLSYGRLVAGLLQFIELLRIPQHGDATPKRSPQCRTCHFGTKCHSDL